MNNTTANTPEDATNPRVYSYRIKGRPSPMDEAEEVARIVNLNGFCLVRCGELAGDLAAFVKDERHRQQVPDGFITYNLLELEIIADLPVESLRMIHRAKVAGAKIIDVSLEVEHGNE